MHHILKFYILGGLIQPYGPYFNKKKIAMEISYKNQYFFRNCEPEQVYTDLAGRGAYVRPLCFTTEGKMLLTEKAQIPMEAT